MKKIYIASTRAFAGKGWITLALIKNLKDRGLNVGYFRPLGTIPIKVGDFLSDEDSIFINRTLGLNLDERNISPVSLSEDLVKNVVEGRIGEVRDLIKQSFDKIKENKDFVIIGGSGAFLTTGRILNLAGPEILDFFDSKLLLIAKYEPDFSIIDEIVTVKKIIGAKLIGVIINSVPKERIIYFQDLVTPFLRKYEIEVIGIIPYEPLFSAVSVKEVAEIVEGEILTVKDGTERLIENFCIGAMQVEGALKYFYRIPNKGVITGGDRSDIQLAALETPTSCLILTGNLYPVSIVLSKAEEKKVPIILTKFDTLTTTLKIEGYISRMPIRGEKKILYAYQLFDKYVDVTKILS